jgi:hypothetical protein
MITPFLVSCKKTREGSSTETITLIASRWLTTLSMRMVQIRPLSDPIGTKCDRGPHEEQPYSSSRDEVGPSDMNRSWIIRAYASVNPSTKLDIAVELHQLDLILRSEQTQLAHEHVLGSGHSLCPVDTLFCQMSTPTSHSGRGHVPGATLDQHGL